MVDERLICFRPEQGQIAEEDEDYLQNESEGADIHLEMDVVVVLSMMLVKPLLVLVLVNFGVLFLGLNPVKAIFSEILGL